MPRPDTDMSGRWRYRRSWTGALILQVEVGHYQRRCMAEGRDQWRDAREHELGMLGLLIERERNRRAAEAASRGDASKQHTPTAGPSQGLG